MRRLATLVATLPLLFAAGGGAVPVSAAPVAIGFEIPSVVDPIHTNGEPDIGIDVQGRVFVSGPTGTGTQRSTWFGSVDGGHTYRVISPGPPPSAITGIVDPPGGGDTDINFDRSGKQYFADLYALLCLRTATTADGGATVNQSITGGCGNSGPGADRQWLAVYDPPPSLTTTSAYTGPKPLIYLEYNNLSAGAQWNKSNSANDIQPGGPGLNYVNALNGGQGYAPFGADGYPAIDQVSGKVFQAAGFQDPNTNAWSLRLNIGTPDATGNLTFLDAPPNTTANLVTIANLPNNPDTLFSVLSMDNARNLYVVYALSGSTQNPEQRQVYVSAATAADGWTHWTTPVRVSQAPANVNVFPWIKAGGAGRADAAWYGTDKKVDPSSHSGQAWDVFMTQLVYPTDASGKITGAPSITMVKVTPHPMHYDDICLQGAGCLLSTGNRNLADFFVITADATGAAEIVYDDTSNGLIQSPIPPSFPQFADHAGAGVITVARQSSGPGLLGGNVSGPSNAPVTGLADAAGDALFPLRSGPNVNGMDILGTDLSRSGDTLSVRTKIVDLSNPGATAQAVQAPFLQYVSRWQLGNTIYYAAMENSGFGSPTFYAGAARSIDLCSVSACFPHIVVYPEPGLGGTAESGQVACPAAPSVSHPCTLTVSVKLADVGNPVTGALLEEVGGYSFSATQPQGTLTNANAEADNVPLEIDGVCCFNFSIPAAASTSGAGAAGGPSAASASSLPFTAALQRSPVLVVFAAAAGLVVVLLAWFGLRRRPRP